MRCGGTPRLHIEHVQAEIARRHQQSPAVGGEGQMLHRRFQAGRLVAKRRADRLAAGRVEEAQRRVRTGQGEPTAVGREMEARGGPITREEILEWVREGRR